MSNATVAALETADTERPTSLAQCSCGVVYTHAEFEALPSHRPWSEFDLEIAECRGCGSTISVEAPKGRQ